MGANEDLQVIDNRLEVRLTGLARQSTPPIPSNIRALIQGNTITGVPGTGAGIGIGVAGLTHSWIFDNVISGLTGEGIVLLAGNTENLVRGNTVTSNGSYGIRATGATGNTFEDNEMLGNGWRPGIVGVDARDDARESNVWRANICLTDFPDGTICGVY